MFVERHYVPWRWVATVEGRDADVTLGVSFLLLEIRKKEDLFITKQPNKKNCLILESLS